MSLEVSTSEILHHCNSKVVTRDAMNVIGHSSSLGCGRRNRPNNGIAIGEVKASCEFQLDIALVNEYIDKFFATLMMTRVRNNFAPFSNSEKTGGRSLFICFKSPMLGFKILANLVTPIVAKSFI